MVQIMSYLQVNQSGISSHALTLHHSPGHARIELMNTLHSPVMLLRILRHTDIRLSRLILNNRRRDIIQLMMLSADKHIALTAIIILDELLNVILHLVGFVVVEFVVDLQAQLLY